VIDTQRISTILTSNRVNSVISDYATDNRVNSIFEDPTAFQYLSKEIVLENPDYIIKNSCKCSCKSILKYKSILCHQ
jgi:hypothetical protein